MNTREFFIKRWEAELPAFGKVLRAVPESQLGYRPHDRSTAAGALAWQLAEEQKQLSELLETGQVEFEIRPHPTKAGDIVAAWDKATSDLRARLKSADEKRWSGPGTFLMGGKVAWTDTVENICWGYLFDMVHHRGQLSAYLRPMGGKVPSIYGPSADDSGS
ncbi:MAG: hypothetical protein NVSMB68_02520 [Thermoanaerobaculia bacterium]